MPTDQLGNVRYPDLTYAPNIPSDMQKAVQDIIVQAVPRFTTTSARDTAYAAYVAGGGVLVDGRECYTEDAGTWVRHNGAWVGLYGLRAYGTSSTSQTANPGPTRLVNGLPVTAYLKAGRAYRFEAYFRVWSTSAADVAQAAARITLGGNSPVVGDPGVAFNGVPIDNSGSGNLYELPTRGTFQVNTSGSYTIGVWVSHSVGSGVITAFPMPSGNMIAEIHDVGIAVSGLLAV